MTLTNDLLADVRDDVTAWIAANITKVGIGDDNTTPTASDTALGNSVFSDTVDAVDTATTGRVVITLEVGSGEANSNTIVEVGGLKTDDTLMDHSLVNSITKTSDIALYVDLRYDVTVTEG